MRKKLLIGFIVFFVGLFLFALWDGEFVALSFTGLGFAIYGYRHEEIEKLEEKVTKRIMRQVDAKIMNIAIYGLLILGVIINFFMDEPQVSLIDAIYVILGVVFGLRGLLIRSVHCKASDIVKEIK